jgi:signal peptide peptidase SppA
MVSLLSMLPSGPYAIYEPAADQIIASLSRIDLHVHMERWNSAHQQDSYAPEGFDAARHVFGDDGYNGRGGTGTDAEGNKTYPFDVTDGVAILSLDGPMSKGSAPSMSRGTSTVGLRRQVRLAKSDPDIKAILMHIDSPGGEVAGTADLGEDVRKASIKKPTYAYIEDVGASAAYWVASQCNAIYANPAALIGSIGVRSAVFDTSKMADNMGVKAYWLVSGDHKAPGALGSVVTPQQIAVLQDSIDRYASQFAGAVNRGRGLSMKMGENPADGRVFVGAQARNIGLIDGVTSFDNVLGTLKKYQPAS